MLHAIDARTGKLIDSFADHGKLDLKTGIDRATVPLASRTPGRIFENLIILGSATGEGYLAPPGDIRAFDVLTGKLVWVFHTIPRPGEYGYETWPKDAYKYMGGVDVWGEFTVDVKRGIVYLPTASAKYELYGGDRHGDNLYADCLLALDARTGKHLWHFQTVHHDLWDSDPSAAPQLVTVRHRGQDRGRRRARIEERVPVRVRSRFGQSAMADRGAAGSEIRCSGRDRVAHPAFPDRSAAFFPPGHDGEGYVRRVYDG